jgi:hypothetical protein
VPPRHQLRTLRCEGAAVLPSLPMLDLLVLVNPKEPLKAAVPPRQRILRLCAREAPVRPR